MKSADNRPIIAIPIGDPVGIGPEIIVQSLKDPVVFEKCRPLVIGSMDPFLRACEVRKFKGAIHTVNRPDEGAYTHGTIDFLTNNKPWKQLKPAQVQEEAGEAAVDYLKKTVELLQSREVDGTATGPTNKAAIRLAGYHYSGVTEFLAHLTSARDVITVILVGRLKIFQITTHVSLRRALELLTYERILENIYSADRILRESGETNPRLAIAGLNPHAGENGLLGDEELAVIIPAISEAQQNGITIDGPIPADSILARGLRGEYDGLLFLMHDQANIGVKLLADRYPPVTYSAGLPIIRTTVAHGTAFDIAYKGIADATPMREAIIAAAEIAMKKKGKVTQ